MTFGHVHRHYHNSAAKRILVLCLVAFISINYSLVAESATWYEFPDFEKEGTLIEEEYVYEISRFNAVPAYLNAANDAGYSSYYQCTEYVARYLHDKFGTDYTDVKDIEQNGQNFKGWDFHPNYSHNPPQPTVDIDSNSIALSRVISPKAGDILVSKSPNHSAIVKSVNQTTVTLIEQNWIWNDNGTYKYTIDRNVDTNDSNLFFYRFNPIGFYAGGWNTDGSSQAILDVYNRNDGVDALGNACDNGGGEYVHEFTYSYNGGNVTVYLQDVCLGDNQKTIVYRPGDDEAYLVEGCLGSLWWRYQGLLGAPTSDEITDTSQFPLTEQEDGFDIMQTFEGVGKLFWDSETGLVRLTCARGTCEEDNIDLCLPGIAMSFNIQSYQQSSSEVSTCDELQANSGLNNYPWPMVGHDVRHSGLSKYPGTKFSAMKWFYQTWYERALPPVISSDGTIYFQEYAINPDGSLKWKGSGSGSLISYERLYSSSVIAATLDGTILWHYDIGKSAYPNNPLFPAIDSNGTIYVANFRGLLHAINPDGSLKWRSWFRSLSSPVIGTKGTVYIRSSDDYLRAINPDGSFKWEFWGCVGSPSIGSGEIIYCSCIDEAAHYNFCAINAAGSLEWRNYYTTNSSGHLDPPLAVNHDGTIYVVVRNFLYAINPDGTLKWKSYLGIPSEQPPVIGSDGTIYVGTNGTVNAISKDGALMWVYGVEVTSPLAMGEDGTIYFECVTGLEDEGLCAIGLPENQGGIYGLVTESKTNMPVDNVTISTINGDTQTTKGGYFNEVLAPDIYEITISADGYHSKTFNNINVSEGKGVELNIELSTLGGIDFITTDLPIGVIGREYSANIRVSGGSGSYYFSIVDGSDPPGVAIQYDGRFTGEPLKEGSYSFVVAVKDSYGAFQVKEYNIEVTTLQYNPYDTNNDWSIGDFELLDAIDAWVAGNLGDFELLDLIDYWAFGSYCCDEANKHQQGVPDEGGMCEP